MGSPKKGKVNQLDCVLNGSCRSFARAYDGPLSHPRTDRPSVNVFVVTINIHRVDVFIWVACNRVLALAILYSIAVFNTTALISTVVVVGEISQHYLSQIPCPVLTREGETIAPLSFWLYPSHSVPLLSKVRCTC